ncbi:MAG: hypothetical protein DLM58_08210 [Pseudonocardiales bacterium]|nr:MAG: hypothetical protein DLM58_08210 [Pseudonocardiales bacterium]
MDGVLSSAAVLLAALFWDRSWSKAAATATVMALLRIGYWLCRWATQDDPGYAARVDLEELERLAADSRFNGRASWKR